MIGSSPLQHSYSIVIVTIILSVIVISATIIMIPIIDSVVDDTVIPRIFVKEVFIYPSLTNRSTYILQLQMMKFSINIIPCLYSPGLDAIRAIQYCPCSKIDQLIESFSPCITGCLDKGDSIIQERTREFSIDAVMGK